MAADLAQTLEVDIEWHQTSWGDLMDTFLSNCDIAVGGISMNPPHAEQVFFSDPILEDGKTSIARCDEVQNYQTIEDINQPDVTSISRRVGPMRHSPGSTSPTGICRPTTI